MILVAGDPADRVVARVRAALERSGAHFRSIDFRDPLEYRIEHRRRRWRVLGGDCRGDEPVGAIFLRHTVVRTHDRVAAVAVHRLRRAIDALVATATCRVVNRPAGGFANYSKPLQLMQLANAGFRTPRTLVSNRADLARAFIDTLASPAICKGISSAKTIPRFVDTELRSRLHVIRYCPVQFQEYIEGEDLRVTVVDDSTFVTRVLAAGPALDPIERTLVPRAVLDKCVAFTRACGLVLGGIDLRRTPAGATYALELNPYPEFTYFEDASKQPITQMVIDYLVKGRARPAILA